MCTGHQVIFPAASQKNIVFSSSDDSDSEVIDQSLSVSSKPQKNMEGSFFQIILFKLYPSHQSSILTLILQM